MESIEGCQEVIQLRSLISVCMTCDEMSHCLSLSRNQENRKTVLTAVGRPVIAKNPRIGAQSGLSGWMTPNTGFLLKYSNTEPTYKAHPELAILISPHDQWVWILLEKGIYTMANLGVMIKGQLLYEISIPTKLAWILVHFSQDMV